MKRYIVFIFSILFIFALVGCDTDDVSSSEIQTTESEYETNSDWEPWR